MAKGRTSGQRGFSNSYTPTANSTAALLSGLNAPLLPSRPLLPEFGPFIEVEDGRTYNPVDPSFRSLTIGGSIARINVAKVVVHKRPVIAYGQPIYAYRGLPRGVQVPVGVKFESPFRVVRCLRRKIRREVIFALRKEKKGAGARHRRHNAFSKVGC